MAEMGPLERAIMAVLWDAERPMLVRDLQERLNATADKPLAYTTVQTVADRLARKGFVRRSPAGKAIVYEATRSRAEHVAQIMLEALTDVADRGPVLARFAERVDPKDAHRLLEELSRRTAADSGRH